MALDLKIYLKAALILVTLSLAAYSLSNTILMIIGYSISVPRVKVFIPEKRSSVYEKRSSPSTYQDIVSRNLFGGIPSPLLVGKKRSIKRHLKDIPLAKTSEIKLRGIVWGPVPYLKMAVIEDVKNRKQNVYMEGDKIRQGILLKKILKDQIVLSINGKTRRLLLNQKKGLLFSSGVFPLSSGEVQISRSVVRDALSNLGQIMRTVRLVPYGSGRNMGFKIAYLQPQSLLWRMGLREGDVVLRINGEEVINTQKLIDLSARISSLKEVSIEILRGGTPHTLRCRLK